MNITREEAELLQSVVGNRQFRDIVARLVEDEKVALYQQIHSATVAANWPLASQTAGQIIAVEQFWSILSNAAKQSQKLTETP